MFRRCCHWLVVQQKRYQSQGFLRHSGHCLPHSLWAWPQATVELLWQHQTLSQRCSTYARYMMLLAFGKPVCPCMAATVAEPLLQEGLRLWAEALAR